MILLCVGGAFVVCSAYNVVCVFLLWLDPMNGSHMMCTEKWGGKGSVVCMLKKCCDRLLAEKKICNTRCDALRLAKTKNGNFGVSVAVLFFFCVVAR